MWLLKRLFALSLILTVFPSLCHGHGSLPVSQQILWRDQTMMVPTPYWGVFLGSDGGPWRWICEEAINMDQQRRFALGKDGTLYATDRNGITVSRDNGCSWANVTTGINTFQVISIVGDPSKPRVWALASAPTPMDTGLWRSDDAGQTWQQAYRLPDHWVSGLRLSEDGQTLAITSLAPTTPRQPMLHVSRDGGANFTAQSVSYQVDGQDVGTVLPLWIDPRAPGDIYIATKDAATNVLLRIGAAGAPMEMMRVTTGIRDMMRDTRNDQLLVATSKGLWAGKGGAALQPLTTLASAQCLSLHGDALYACGWNYAPDQAAITRLSSDATIHTKVFQYHETEAPVDCPANTPVSQICPGIWMNYADQLGIDLSQRGNMPKMEESGCALTTRSSSSAFGLAFAAGLLSWLLRRRRHGANVRLERMYADD